MRLTLLAVALPLFAVAAPLLQPRQVLTILDIYLEGSFVDSPVYVSTGRIYCEPYKVAFSGLHPLFTIDVVASPIPTNRDSATTLASLSSWNGSVTPQAFTWRPELAVGTRFKLRVRDAEGTERYGFEHWVMEGSSAASECRDLDAWSEGTWSIIGIVGGVCTLAITCFFISLHEERVRRANEAALLPSVPTPTPAQEVSIETLRTSLFQTVDVLLQRGGGTDSVEAVELSTVFEGEDEDESDEEEEDGHKRVRQGLLPRYEEVST